MAGQAKPAPQGLTDEEMQFNRQVNYFIMRYMWQVIRGRNGKDTIYQTFRTSRERYTRIINTGVVRYGKGELDYLTETTGLKKGIFTGEVRFDCPYGDKKPLNKITQQEWDTMLQWRQNRTGVNGTKSPQDEVCEKLRQVDKDNADNWDFFQLCYFLKEQRPAPSLLTQGQFNDLINSIQGLSFSMLDRCETKQLTSLQKLLNQKSKLLSGIIIYKSAKAAEKKK